MKKIKSIPLLLFCCALICTAFGMKSIIGKNLVNEANEVVVGTSNSQMYQMDDISDFVKYSDNVIIGTVLDGDEIDAFSAKNTIRIDEIFKGSIESKDIDVYETINTLEKGKQYLLFLGYHDSALYPREVYTSIDKEMIIEVKNKKIVSQDHIDDGLDYKSIIKSIEKIPNLKDIKIKHVKVQNKYDDYISQVEESDHVVSIVVKDMTIYNKYTSEVKIDIINQYKGDLDNCDSIILTSDLEIGKEYLVFLKRLDDGSLVLSSRKGSIINSNSTQEWENALEIFN